MIFTKNIKFIKIIAVSTKAGPYLFSLNLSPAANENNKTNNK